MTETRAGTGVSPPAKPLAGAHLRRRLCARRASVAGVRPRAGRRYAALRGVWPAECGPRQRRAGLPCALRLGAGGLLVAGDLCSRRGSVAGARFCHLHQYAGFLLRLDRARLGGPGDRQGLRAGLSAGFHPRQCAGAGQAAGLAGHPAAAAGSGRLHWRHAGAGLGHARSRSAWSGR